MRDVAAPPDVGGARSTSRGNAIDTTPPVLSRSIISVGAGAADRLVTPARRIT
jgi:hypothetical protein